MELKVLKCNLDFMRLPNVQLFTDSKNKEWVMIPVDDCQIFRHTRENGMPTAVINIDIWENLRHPEYGNTHEVRWYDKEDKTSLFVGGGVKKIIKVDNWKQR